MRKKKSKKFFCWLIVLGLVFPSGIAYAAEDYPAGTGPAKYDAQSVEDGTDGLVLDAAPFCPVGARIAGPPALNIKSVEVLTGGPVQILYRDTVYEEGGKYYTTRREINLKDPRSHA